MWFHYFYIFIPLGGNMLFIKANIQFMLNFILLLSSLTFLQLQIFMFEAYSILFVQQHT